MPLPANWTTVAVTWTIIGHDGTPAKGVVRFTSAQVVTADGGTYVPAPITARVTNGVMEAVSLPTTDDPDISPTGWTWRVQPLTSPDGPEAFNILVPAAGGPINLATVVPVSSPTPLSAVAIGDQFIAGRVNDVTGPSQTRTALDAAYAPGGSQIAESRGGLRHKVARRPAVTIDQVYPDGVGQDFILLHADGNNLWATASDTALRKSTDAGATWTKVYYPGGLGSVGKSGLFFKTLAGSLITTYDPFDLTEPKIVRSADNGVTWSDVVAAQANVQYLGPTNIAQDPVTEYLYLSEYVTVNAATKATWKISRSTDDGATWGTFHTFQRDAVANPTTAVRHGHFVQWDPVGQRIWFGCGDGEQAAGLYRINAAGTDVESVVTKAQIGADFSAGAVSAMFFPDYIAWGHDQRSDKGLIRMARDQIGQAAPTLELVAYLQSTSFYAVRTKADNTEWLLTVSNENGIGGRLDNALHVYRVADNGATIDEVLTVPWSRDDATFGWLQPVGGAVLGDGPMWLATPTTPSPTSPSTGSTTGFAIRVRPTWGSQTLLRPDATLRKPHGQPVTVASGNESLTASQAKAIGSTEAPPRATRLYVLEVTAEKYSGDGAIYAEVYDQTGGTVLKMEDAVTNMQWQHRSRKATLNEASSPWIARSAALSPGRQLRFRILNGLGGGTTAEGAVTITYAWGF